MKRAAVLLLFALCEVAACRGASQTPTPDAGSFCVRRTASGPCVVRDAGAPPADATP